MSERKTLHPNPGQKFDRTESANKNWDLKFQKLSFWNFKNWAFKISKIELSVTCNEYPRIKPCKDSIKSMDIHCRVLFDSSN